MHRGDYFVRPATLADEPAVTRVLSQSYPTLLAAHYDPRLLERALPMMTRANPRLLRSGTYYVACDANGNVLGCGGWTPERPGTGALEPSLGHLRHFAVDPAATRRGIGRELLSHAIHEADARGFPRLECFATLSAEAFYRSAGFATIRNVDVDMGGVAFPSLLMRRA
ncbi:MAG: GNAT family N-acetyltransferase [Hyphomicrobiaceae bacterium]